MGRELKRITGKSGRLFYPLLFAAALVYIGFRIFDYHEASLAVGLSSRSIRFQQGVLRHGVNIVPRDLLRGFDVLCFDDGHSRVRFVGWTFETFDAKFLLWLARFLPPHPSLSLGWIFTLVLTPLFFFKLIRLLTGNRAAAWLCVTLLVLSAGSLSGITLRDSAVKPLVNFFTVFTFYLAARISGEPAGAGNLKMFAVMLAALFVSFLVDETAWFLYPAVPIMFPALFLPRGRGLFRGLYLSLIAVFLIFVTFLAPVLVERYGSGEFDFWSYMLRSEEASAASVWEWLNVGNILPSARNMIVSQFVPWEKPGWAAAYLLVLPYLAYLFLNLSAEKKKMLLRSTLLLCAYLVFITFYWSRGDEYQMALETPYYYGALFSVFILFPLAVLFSRRGPAFQRAVNAAIVIFMAVVFMYNFPFIHRQERGFFGDHSHRLHRLTFSDVYWAWRFWDDPDVRERFIASYPERWFWFFPLTPPAVVEGSLSDSPPDRGQLLLEPELRLSSGPYPGDYPPVSNLLDGSADTFWRAPVGEDPPWVTADFRGRGERQGARVMRVAMLPRPAAPEEFPRRAELLGSMDGEVWTLVAPLSRPSRPPGDRWVIWSFRNHAPYRMYRLVFEESHSGRPVPYVSLSGLSFTE